MLVSISQNSAPTSLILSESFVTVVVEHLLWIPFRYFFSFRSKIVYLSLGSISSSVGISFFHLSIAFAVIPCLDSALSTVRTTVSTSRRRFRWRAFWG